MTQEALRMALEALEWCHGGEPIGTAEAIAAIKEALAQEKTLQALHSENKRLGLYKDAYAQPKQDIAELVTGMEVSIDVSTGDHDSGHRLYGVVDLVQQSQGSKHGLILLVQETEANFKEALAQEQEPVNYEKLAALGWQSIECPFCGFAGAQAFPQRTWVGLTRDKLNMICDSMKTWNSFSITDIYFAIEAELKEKNT